MNPLCQKGDCTKPHGEVRILPWEADDFVWDWVALCRTCFEQEVTDRLEKNVHLPERAKPYYTPPWNECRVINTDQIRYLRSKQPAG